MEDKCTTKGKTFLLDRASCALLDRGEKTPPWASGLPSLHPLRPPTRGDRTCSAHLCLQPATLGQGAGCCRDARSESWRWRALLDLVDFIQETGAKGGASRFRFADSPGWLATMEGEERQDVRRRTEDVGVALQLGRAGGQLMGRGGVPAHPRAAPASTCQRVANCSCKLNL